MHAYICVDRQVVTHAHGAGRARGASWAGSTTALERHGVWMLPLLTQAPAPAQTGTVQRSARGLYRAFGSPATLLWTPRRPRAHANPHQSLDSLSTAMFCIHPCPLGHGLLIGPGHCPPPAASFHTRTHTHTHTHHISNHQPATRQPRPPDTPAAGASGYKGTCGAPRSYHCQYYHYHYYHYHRRRRQHNHYHHH